jgi:hypothetical protein
VAKKKKTAKNGTKWPKWPKFQSNLWLFFFFWSFFILKNLPCGFENKFFGGFLKHLILEPFQK